MSGRGFRKWRSCIVGRLTYQKDLPLKDLSQISAAIEEQAGHLESCPELSRA